jgi:hypothetical protein
MKLKKSYKAKWEQRWKNGKKGSHTRMLDLTQTGRTLRLHKGREKHTSSLIIQLHTGKIGFNSSLHERRVPGFQTTECECTNGEMTVEHVLLQCEKWDREREETIEKLRTRNLRSILNSRQGTRAATEFILRAALLEQFNHVRERESESRE